jgi:hypothetical protein
MVPSTSLLKILVSTTYDIERPNELRIDVAIRACAEARFNGWRYRHGGDLAEKTQSIDSAFRGLIRKGADEAPDLSGASVVGPFLS